MATRRLARFLMALFCATVLAFVFAIHYSSPMTNVITRWPGSPNVDDYSSAGKKCNASDPSSWGYGRCSGLIDYVNNDLSEIQKRDIAIGSTIIGLLPTILFSLPPDQMNLSPRPSSLLTGLLLQQLSASGSRYSSSASQDLSDGEADPAKPSSRESGQYLWVASRHNLYVISCSRSSPM